MQVLFNGLTTGALYALVASGLLLIFGILEIPDFALGGRIMLGGYVGYFSVTGLHLNYWIALVLGAAAAAALGMVSELVVYRRLRSSPLLAGFIGALVLLTATEIIAQLLWSANKRKMPGPFGGDVLEFAGVRITEQRLVAGIIALALIALLHVYLRRTRSGQGMRATLEDREGAELLGISPNRMSMLAMVIGSALGGAGGVLLAPIYLVYPTMGDNILINGLIVIVLAGMRSSLGVIVGAFAIGLAENYGAVYLSVGYANAYAFVLLIIALIIRPNGLFSRQVRER